MAFKAELLRKKLKEEGKTRKFLAQVTGKRERTVSRWLNGQNPPKGKDLDLIASALKCRPQDFDPSYADEGLGVAMYARVSVASHNAYEMMRLRYGVTQKSIIELAPVLFSIVAGHALKIPEDDMALHDEAVRRGLASPLPGAHSYQGATGFAIDQRASETGACFGLPADNPMDADPRNLFAEALSRLSMQINDCVSLEFFHAPEPGEVPSATGFAPDVDLLRKLTGGDAELIRALVDGRVRLSKCWEDYQNAGKSCIVEFAQHLQREVAKENDRHQTQLSVKREASLSKLQAWRSYYQELHPELAREYDHLVVTYCHEEGWTPEYYGEGYGEIIWANPFEEQRFINADLLPDDQKANMLASLTSPIAKRFAELKAHRDKLKAQFQELGE